MEVETITNGSPSQETTSSGVAEGANSEKSGSAKQPDVKSAGAGDAGAETPAERKFRLKFGKQDREVTEQELIALGQKGWAADSRFQEASKMMKEIKDAIENGDEEFFIKKKYGKDKISYAKEILKAELRKATMSPEDRAVAEKREELARLKAEENEIMSRRDKEKMDTLTNHYSEQYDKELSDAISSEGLPKTRYAVGRAVALAKKVVDMGLDPDWNLVVKEAKRQMQAEMKDLFEAAKDDNSLLALLGDSLPMRISKAMVGRPSKQQVGQIKAVEQKGDGFKQKDRKDVDIDAWLEERRKNFK